MFLEQKINYFRISARVFANDNVKLHVTILTLITLQGSVHTYIRWTG